MSAASVCCFETGWTEKRLHIKVVPLLVCQRRSLGIARNLVESRFIGVVPDQVGLFIVKALVSNYIDPLSMFEMQESPLTMRANFPCCERRV